MKKNNLFTSILPVFLIFNSASSLAAKAYLGLTEKAAIERKKHISKVDYTNEFFLDRKPKEYRGSVTIDFDYSGTSKKRIPLDFRSGQIHEFLINGHQVKPRYDGFTISLNEKILKKGRNQIKIQFTKEFSRNAAGIYRFEDPADKNIYIYTDLEPFDGNRVFPCFDQPDLKATYQFTVEAPKKWTVVSSDRETEVKNVSKGKKRWIFPRTKRFSTYLFSLHAGPYHVWTSNAGKIPLRLFARKSLRKYVKPNEWFKVTRQGFKFFQNYFKYPYPFSKYDQLIVPDFNAGAMENVGAVTFSEGYVRRGTATRYDRLRKASVILHELAHMWFGNLTTMKWWDDLWLNESFATYMAALAMAEATEFKESWQTFFLEASSTGTGKTNFQQPIQLPLQSRILKPLLQTLMGFPMEKVRLCLNSLRSLSGQKVLKKASKPILKSTSTRTLDFQIS